jgi:hypothetical protein
VRPAKKWMMWRDYKHWTAILGIRADEPQRVNRTTAKNERWTCAYPLHKAGVTRRDVAAWWANQPFDLNLPTIGGKTPLGNCDGCFLKSEKTRAFLARYYPERARWWADQEMACGGGATFRHEMAWETLIAFARDQKDWVFDAESDVLCDADFGGCHD